MKTKVEVANQKEAKLIKAGLNDPTTRALTKVVGALSTLPSDRAKLRVLRYVEDYFNENAT